MRTKADIKAEAERLQSHFVAAGAEPVDVDILQPAEVLLDIYGEDIRARAYVTQDPLRGETMLRPDFTVPVAQKFLASEANAARYTYSGAVFRRQEEDETRAREYIQVGYECFGYEPASVQDADVFAAMSNALDGLALDRVIGDVAIVSALIDDLDVPERRKRALRRHIWRPARFNALLERFATQPVFAPAWAPGAQRVGLRSEAEIVARLEAQEAEALTPPIPRSAIDHISQVLSVQGPMPQAVAQLDRMAANGSALAVVAELCTARTDALSDAGMDPATMQFQSGYGRSTMEYYGGFVFGFSPKGRTSGPPVATGGRFDMVTAVLGRSVPAVGGVIRPDLVLGLGS